LVLRHEDHLEAIVSFYTLRASRSRSDNEASINLLKTTPTMTIKNGMIIHQNEAPTCVIVKGYEAVALLDSHPTSHSYVCFDALVALLNLDDMYSTHNVSLENATGWSRDTLKGYVASLADDRGYDYYNIVKFTSPTLTDTQPSLQAEYDMWLKANCPQALLDDPTYEITAENLMLHTRDGGWVKPDENLYDFWVDDYQVDYLRAFCRRWDVVENYVSDEEIEEEESGTEVAEAREGCIHD
jgi:hypothetical protein